MSSDAIGDSLGNRMKGYELATRTSLPRRMPVIVRVDGKAFHSYTRKCARPFDYRFAAAMDLVAKTLCEEMQGAVLAYVQSDEVSVLLHNYKRHATAAWFDNEVQKIVSVAASIAGSTMTLESYNVFGGDVVPAYFDARVFVLPEADVCNYFIWRQQDATRNSIQMSAQALYSPAEMYRKNTSELQDMMHEKGVNWNEYSTRYKRGRCVERELYSAGDDAAVRSRWVMNSETPIFSTTRDYIERHLVVEPEDPKPTPLGHKS